MEVLQEKSFRSYDYISRYQQFPYYFNQQDGKYIYGTTAHIDTSAGYSIHKVRNGDTFDSIALDYYNNPTLYWIICDFNKVQDPFKKLEDGEQIKVPVLSSVVYVKER